MDNQQQFKCTGDCLKCMPVQRQYCSCQNSYNTMRMLQDMQALIEELEDKISAIEDNEALVFAPHLEQDTTQEGDGVEE